jgi:hypothetical protein
MKNKKTITYAGLTFTSLKAHQGQMSWKSMLWLAVFALLISSCGLVLYQYEKTATYLSVSSGLSHLKAVFFAPHTPLQAQKTKSVLAHKESTEPAVHFEFYTTLPNMQISAKETSSSPEKSKPTPAVVTKTNPKIANASELEKELLSQIKPSTYVIQLGFFRKANAAEQYRRFLWQAGLTKGLLKVATEKEGYCVQLGPFATKNQAKMANLRLQKRGIHGLVRLTHSSQLTLTKG